MKKLKSTIITILALLFMAGIAMGVTYVDGKKFGEYDEVNSTIYKVNGSQINYADLAGYQQVLVVAKAGADYTSIQSAINAITDAATGKRYAVLVMPGDYAETVTMKDYVDIIGTGRTNSRITGTSGTVLTFPANKATISDMGIYVNYGALGANSTAITSAGADSIMLRCDITVAKSSGDYTMNTITVTGGSFRMIDSYHYYSITGATTDSSLTQSAVVQSGALTEFLLYNSEITMTSDDTNDDLVGFETITAGAGTYLLKENIIELSATGAGATATGFWLYGTATGARISNNRLTIAGTGSSYGIYIDSTAGGATVYSRHNDITVTSSGAATAGTAATGDTWDSSFDTITASTVYAGAGTITMVSSPSAGNLQLTGININSYENVTCASDAGTAAVTVTTTFLTTENAGAADVVSLADGTAGQIKIIVLKTDSGDNAVITPNNFGGGATVTLDTEGESAWFQFDGTNWQLISTHGGAVG